MRQLKWFVFNAGAAYLAWIAVNGSRGASNLLVACAWFNVFVYLATASCQKAKDDLRKKGRPIPAWLSHGYDTVMAGFLIWNAWWFTAFAIIIGTFCEAAIFVKPTEEAP